MTFAHAILESFKLTLIFVEKAWSLLFIPVIPGTIYALSQTQNLESSNINTPTAAAIFYSATIITVLATYWTIRFFAIDQSVRSAVAINRQSMRTFLPYFVFYSAFWCGMEWLIKNESVLSIAAMGVVALLLQSLLAAWSVAAPSGSNSIGPVVSARVSATTVFWGFGLLMVVAVPFQIMTGMLAISGVDVIHNTWMNALLIILVASIEAVSIVTFYAATYVIALKVGVRIGKASTDQSSPA